MAEAPQPPVSADLRQSIEAFCQADTLRKRRNAFVEIVRWTRAGQRSGLQSARLLTFLQLLEADAELRQRFQQSVGLLLDELDCMSLFAEAGLPSVHPFTTEIVQRSVAKVMPSARSDDDACKLLSDLYSSERYAKQFAGTPPELFDRVCHTLTPADDPDFWQRQEGELREALRLLSARVSGLGLQPEMRERSTPTRIAHSPFYELVLKTEELIASSSSESTVAVLDAWKQLVARCRGEMEIVYEHMESAGISVELVFDLKSIQACLARMETIVKVVSAADAAERRSATQAMLSRLIEGNVTDKQLRSLLRENLNLLARKVVDRTGDTGEHYIANTRRIQELHMWMAALGGGL